MVGTALQYCRNAILLGSEGFQQGHCIGFRVHVTTILRTFAGGFLVVELLGGYAGCHELIVAVGTIPPVDANLVHPALKLTASSITSS